MDKVLDLFGDFAERLLKLEEEKSHISAKVEEKIVDVVDKKVKEAFEEESEKRRLRPNIVVVNVPESKSDDVEQRQKDDIEATAAILDKVMGGKINRGEFKDPIRMGNRVIGKKSKPRLLKITVANEDFRKKIFKNARNINEGVKDKRKMVFINPDRTQKERDDYKKLKEELVERQKVDPDLRISRGKICKKPTKSNYNRNSGDQATKEDKQVKEKDDINDDDDGDGSSGSDSESDTETE